MRKCKWLLAMLPVFAILAGDVCALAEELVLLLPKAMKIIEEEAFFGDTSIEKVVVPEGAEEIRARAFANSSVSEAELPESLNYIAEDAFDNCANLTIYGKNGSTAEEYADSHHIPFVGESEYPESAHPYPDDFDYTWVYDAGDDAESVTVTFSSDTETEDGFDFIYLYDLNDVQIGKYSGKALAGEEVYSGTVIRPETIRYVPMEAGDYTLSVTASDADGVTTQAYTSKIRASDALETPGEYFTYTALSNNALKITGYTGEDNGS